MISYSDMVSIILPVYNAESYIEEAIVSILKQSYENFELIIINDGSSDKSGVICERYKNQDSRIKYLYQENSGISIARNNGIKVSSGQYICFCDHDDVYNTDYILKMLSCIKDNKVDVVCSAYKEVVSMSGKIVKQEIRTPVNEANVWEKSNLFDDYVCYQHLFTTIWNCMYTKRIIEDIWFDSNLRYGGEDIIFNLSIINKNARIGKIKDVLYTHYKRIGQSASSKLKRNRIDSMLACLSKEKEIISQNSKYVDTNLINKCEAYYLGGVINVVMKAGNTNVIVELLKELRNSKNVNWSSVYKRTNMGLKYDLIYYLFLHKKYRLIYFLCKIKGKMV